MITKDLVPQVVGKKVVGPGDEKIGDIDTVYLDDDTDEPEFALVSTGLLGTRSSFVPLRDAELRDEAVAVPYSKDQIKEAPDIDADERISERDEAELYAHYGLRPAAGPGQAGPPAGTGERERGPVGRDVRGAVTDDAMTRSEEELEVGTRRREAGKARLRKHVVTEHVTRTVPVQREEVRLEREPVTEESAGQAMEGPEISDSEHEVTLMREEPVVEKRAVPKERVRLDKDTVTEEREVGEDVRREEIDIDGEERR